MTSHSWKFYRIGGLDQVAFETGEDLLQLRNLDPKLWVALSCPVKGLELDERTLALIDSDNDGRIRVPELLAAIDWAVPFLRDASVLLQGRDTLALADISDATPAGKSLLVSARRILAAAGKNQAAAISLAEACDSAKVLAASAFNGDGVIVPASTDDAFLKGAISDISACLGADKDRGGESGLGLAKVNAFFDQAGAALSWFAKGASPEILTLGEKTAAAAAAVQAVKAKVDDYFARCRVASYDGRAVNALNRSEADFAALAAKDLTCASPEIASFPLARIDASCVLPLASGVNPAWAAALATLRCDAVAVAFGGAAESINEAEWTALQNKVAAFLAWSASDEGASVRKLGEARLRELVSSTAKAGLGALIEADLAAAPEFEALASVERLLRYCRDFRTLLGNFVNFFDFYSKDRWAIFQAGTLYLDNRSTELCVRVDGAGAHAGLATMSKIFIAYAECRRPGEAPITIAACFTQGDSDFLFVGRNGIFYDRKGRDWDATISKIIDNPISIRQAFWSPYKKFIRMIEEQVAKRAAAADAAANTKLSSAAATAANADKAAPAPAQKKIDVGVVAALGVAISGLISALTLILGYVLGLVYWQYPLVIVALMLVISTPSMLIAWLKLRQRNLGPILEANGWAINGRVMINIPFGTALTEKAVLPANARRSLTDPYADDSARKTRIWLAIISAVLLAAAFAASWYLKTWPFSPGT